MVRGTLALGALLLAAGSAAAQEEGRWSFSAAGRTAYLSFGGASGEDTLFSLACNTQRGTLTVTAMLDTGEPQPGKPATIKLTAGARTLTLSGRGRANEMYGTVDVVASGPFDPALVALVNASTPLVVEVPGASQTLARTTLGDKAARFEAACRKPRG